MSRERLDTQHVGDLLWQRAITDLGHEACALFFAYQAGRADAARDVLKSDQRKAHDAALDIFLQASDAWHDALEQ
jgi:hypothetical protein